MTVILILFCILLFFALILSMRLKLYFILNGSFRLRAGLGPVIFDFFSEKERKPVKLNGFSYKKHQKRLAKDKKLSLKKSKKKTKAKRVRELSKKADEAEKNSSESTEKLSIEFITELVEFVLAELPRLSSYTKTEVKCLNITVAGRDAASCAIKYGYIAQAVSYLIALLESSTDMKKPKPDAVSVKADFLAEKTVTVLDISLKLSLYSIARVCIHTLSWLIGAKLKKH